MRVVSRTEACLCECVYVVSVCLCGSESQISGVGCLQTPRRSLFTHNAAADICTLWFQRGRVHVPDVHDQILFPSRLSISALFMANYKRNQPPCLGGGAKAHHETSGPLSRWFFCKNLILLLQSIWRNGPEFFCWYFKSKCCRFCAL